MAVVAGKDLERYWQHHDALLAFHRLFNERETVDERAIAIVGATFLDNMLEHILVNFMVDDEKESKRMVGVDCPLGTFSSRVTAAYCLGLICKTVRDDLRAVGKIRNKFAHQLEAAFEIEPIRGWCLSLRWHEFSMMMKAPADATSRDVFKVGVNQLITHLSGIVSIARLERRKVRDEDNGGPTLLR
ncbi:hypothetical protein FJ527_08735 [Mesorhizobium sp. B2-4-18]|uniref:hypothetical protein n=1 Tax=Mesorhizobium sp. B2-4-18 TaxID=2589931 RepID=UPI0011293A00|nr:hypothetical protein [Mesorhizobium sp. B2-4-18]TPK78549.1 hypothetical protein FJ527_08735 [Mesorhizobium sp. B2-4-18]